MWGRVVCDLASYEGEYEKLSLSITGPVVEGSYSQILAGSEGPFTLELWVGSRLSKFENVTIHVQQDTVHVTWKG